MKNYTNVLYWIAMAGLFMYFAYTKGWILVNFDSITPKQASALLQNDTTITLLDVRSMGEFEQAHIEGAMLIPVEILSENLSKLQGKSNKKIIVYCRSGSRSVKASRMLADHGFMPLNVEGGMVEWEKEGLPKK